MYTDTLFLFIEAAAKCQSLSFTLLANKITGMFLAKIRLTGLILFLLATLTGSAQRLWSLEECLTYALENNLTLKQQQLNVMQTEVNLKEAQYQRWPSLNAAVGNSYNFGRSIDPFTNANVQRNSTNFRFGLSAGLVLFNGFQIHNTIHQQRQLMYASRFDLEVSQNDIGMNIANAYLQVLFAKELVNNGKEQVASTTGQLDRAEKFYAAGRIAESGVLDMKAQLANDQLTLVNAENQEKLAKVTLFQLLELSPDSNDVRIPEVDTVPDAGIYSAMQLYSLYIEKSPELKAAGYRMEASNYAWKVAKGAYSPRLTVGADIGTLYSNQALSPVIGQTLFYQQLYDENGTPIAQIPITNVISTSTTPFGDQWNNNLGQTIGLNLSIPIFNNYSAKAGVKRAEIGYQSALLNKEIADNTVQMQITQAFIEYEAAKARFEASQASFNAQKESFAYAEKRWEANVISEVEYRMQLNNYQLALSTFLQAKYELMFRYKIIDFYKHGTVYPTLH